jgi:hypothetical protein
MSTLHVSTCPTYTGSEKYVLLRGVCQRLFNYAKKVITSLYINTSLETEVRLSTAA